MDLAPYGGIAALAAKPVDPAGSFGEVGDCTSIPVVAHPGSTSGNVLAATAPERT